MLERERIGREEALCKLKSAREEVKTFSMAPKHVDFENEAL